MKIANRKTFSIILGLCAAALTAAAAPGEWTGAGAMSYDRYLLTVSRLPDGRVLAAGGVIEGDFNSADLYDPSTNTWSPAADMNTGHSAATATNLLNGTVLVAGGFSNVAEVYNPQINQWTLTGPMNQSRTSAAASLLPSGQVLVTGGCSGFGSGSSCSSTEIYDPQTNVWTAGPPLLTARVYHTSSRLPDGMVLIAGGMDVNDNPISSAELYNSAANMFTYTGSMNTGHISHTASLLFSGEVLIAGGLFGSNVVGSAEVYAPSTGLWSLTGAMKNSRENHTATLLQSGAVLVAGGENDCSDELCTTTDTAEVYDPQTGAWSFTDSMGYREGAAAVLLKNKAALVAGGENSSVGNFLASAERYIP
jgi:hypothetical protein